MIDEYGDPYGEVGKTLKPIPQSRWDAIKRRRTTSPAAIGPIQKAVTVATSNYNHYRELYEEEKEKGHINTEMRKRTEVYGKLSKDLNALLRLLRTETQNAFLAKNVRKQKATKKKTTMLTRAIRLVAR